MADPARKLATYDDVLDAPENMIAELIDGELLMQARPATFHSATAGTLSASLIPPFQRGHGGPGGWLLLYEPELHLGPDILVPDLAGWRRERLPTLPDAPFLSLAPDWVCEILSPSTARIDRVKKARIYAREKVPYLWFVDPQTQLLEVKRLENGHWLEVATFEGEDVCRPEPFDAIDFELGVLWEH
jgi:Uma2 family endonuclease